MGWSGLEAVLSLLAKRLSNGTGTGAVRPELVDLTSIRCVGPARARLLYRCGFRTVEQVAAAEAEDLAMIIPLGGFGRYPLTIAKKIVFSARDTLRELLSADSEKTKAKQDVWKEIEKKHSQMKGTELAKLKNHQPQKPIGPRSGARELLYESSRNPLALEPTPLFAMEEESPFDPLDFVESDEELQKLVNERLVAIEHLSAHPDLASPGAGSITVTGDEV
jgi:hypothetical protein